VTFIEYLHIVREKTVDKVVTKEIKEGRWKKKRLSGLW
jgi:hypothetical protein